MAKRTPWNQLKPEYRARLESKGITEKMHASGTSLAKARGHENTPERPAVFDVKKYPKYAGDRQKLVNEVKKKKQEFFGDRPKWDSEKSNAAFRKRPPTMAQLRWAAHADRTEDDFLDEIRDDDAIWRFLGYH